MSAERDLIARLLGVFGEPKTPDPEVFLEEFAKAIKGWDPVVLQRAGDDIIRTSTFWPKPAEIIETAGKIASAMYTPTAPKLSDDGWPEPTPEQKARAQALVDGLARRMASAKIELRETGQPFDTSKPAFEAMQARSRNAVTTGLSPVSRRQTGEHQE